MTHAEPNKSFPIRCAECGKNEVRPAEVGYTAQKNHDGRVHSLRIERMAALKCSACGELLFTNESDDQIAQALRDRLGLLSPAQIRANIATLGVTQKHLATCLGVAAESLSRWLAGTMIQSRAIDNLMRAYFGNAQVRSKLTGTSMDRTFGVAPTPTKRRARVKA